MATPPKVGETGEVVISLSDRDAPAPKVSLNGVEPHGQPVKEQNEGRYGKPFWSPLVYRYKFPPTAIRKGRNEVRVRPVAKPSVMLRWAEISIF